MKQNGFPKRLTIDGEFVQESSTIIQTIDRPSSDPLSWLKQKAALLNVVLSVGLLLALAAGLFISLLQFVNYLFVKPVDIRWYRRVNYYLQYASLSQLVGIYEWWAGSKLTMFYADEETERGFGNEHLIGLANHRFDLDPVVHWTCCEHHGCLGSAKAFVKKTLKYVPIVGWSFFFGESIILDRNWQSDVKKIGPALDKLMDHEMNMMLMLAPEGTRFTKEKHRVSMEFAKSKGLKTYKYHLLPRIKGFATAIRHLKEKYPNCGVYNIQLKVNGPNDSFSRMFKGRAADAEMYIRKIKMEEISAENDEKIAEFLYDLFDEKDNLVEYHKKHGKFPGKMVPKTRNLGPLISNCICQMFVAPSLFYFLWSIFTSGNLTLISTASAIILFLYVAFYFMLGVTEIEKSSSYGKLEPKKKEHHRKSGKYDADFTHRILNDCLDNSTRLT